MSGLGFVTSSSLRRAEQYTNNQLVSVNCDGATMILSNYGITMKSAYSLCNTAPVIVASNSQ